MNFAVKQSIRKYFQELRKYSKKQGYCFMVTMIIDQLYGFTSALFVTGVFTFEQHERIMKIAKSYNEVV